MSVTHEDTRGWDAIEAAVALVVADPSPLHWGTGTVPGQTGIYGLSADRADGHWLLVTFGLTDLFGQDQGAEVSGWGWPSPRIRSCRASTRRWVGRCF